MSEEANEAAKAAREATELLKKGKRLSKEDKKRLEELYARWKGARDEAWRNAEAKIKSTLRVRDR